MHCTLRCFLNVLSVMRHLSRYALWQDIFKIVIPFMHCAMISFHCVVNMILGLTNIHRRVWKLIPGSHRSGIKADVDLVAWP